MQLISFRNGQSLDLPVPEELDPTPTDAVLEGVGRVSLRAWRVDGDEQVKQAVANLGSLARASGLALRRPLAWSSADGRLVVAEESPDGVTLETLRRFVPLTFDQAAVVAEGLLAAVAALEQAHTSHGDLGWTTAVLGVDGRVRFTAPNPFATSPGGDRRAVAAMASTLLAEASAASRRGAPADLQDRLLTLVQQLDLRERSVASLLGSWRQALSIHLDPRAKRKVRNQLQALAARLLELDPGPAPLPGGRARPRMESAEPSEQPLGAAAVVEQPPPLEPRRPDPPEEPMRKRQPAAPRPWIGPPARAAEASFHPPAAEPPAPIPPPARDRPATGAADSLSPPRVRQDWPRRPVGPNGPRPRWVALGAVVVVLLLVVAGGSALLLHQGVRSTTSGRSHQSPGSSPSPASGRGSSSPGFATPSPSPQTPALREIPLLGPPSNGPIQNVQVTSGCPATGSGSCTFTVTAHLGSHPADTVGWQLDMVNRCTGAVTEVASGDIPAAADYTYVEAQPDVTVPASIPVGMVALAGAPGQAASAPLLIDPTGASCSG